MKKNNQTLFAIYKNSIHKGNSYGKSQEDAIKNYLLQSYSIQVPNILIDEILLIDKINEFNAIKAIAKIHYVQVVN